MFLGSASFWANNKRTRSAIKASCNDISLATMVASTPIVAGAYESDLSQHKSIYTGDTSTKQERTPPCAPRLQYVCLSTHIPSASHPGVGWFTFSCHLPTHNNNLVDLELTLDGESRNPPTTAWQSRSSTVSSPRECHPIIQLLFSPQLLG